MDEENAPDVPELPENSETPAEEPEKKKKPDLRFNNRVDRGVSINEELNQKGHLARGSFTNMSNIRFSVKAKPRDYADPELQALHDDPSTLKPKHVRAAEAEAAKAEATKAEAAKAEFEKAEQARIDQRVAAIANGETPPPAVVESVPAPVPQAATQPPPVAPVDPSEAESESLIGRFADGVRRWMGGH